MRLPLLALALALSADPSLAGPASEQPRLEGRYSNVTLLEVSRPPERVHADAADGAPDSLAFFFLVSRRPGAQGLFSLREPRDFELEGRLYSALTRASLGRGFEPRTIIEDVPDFVARMRPDLAQSVAAVDAGSDRLVLFTLIPGARLPDRSRGRMEIEVGWGSSTEAFAFDFRAPERLAR